MEVTSNVLTFASGKGGVGKSVVTTNLAETLAREGHRVALLDADLGQSDAAVLLNEAPATTVWGAVQEDAALRAVPHETEGRVTLVQAANRPPPEAPDARDALYAALDTLLGRLRETHDYVLVDASAGTDGPVQWALDRADLGVLVVVGEPTAVADAYRLAKQLWSADPDYPLGLVVNFAEDEDDARSIGERFKAVTTRFLGQAPKTLGWIPFSHAVRRSVSDQTPVVRSEGPARDAFADLADTTARGQYALSPALS
ncbi:flagellar biosynthesis protein FlhG [Salinibacter ruber]|uniref:P-loop NTPase n=1 Tax=Salinibacter ruber TaxID=146919 RepID=UPI002169D02F|nr:P-loop NTPase [Salinibacter ruber]MCS3649601.1 flagellar biosynthesis protein FlhG [Salinibacter ruber]MCS3652855.1 flagellar biosynthesis protein FlhG [Salinibacter ruber]